MPNIDLLAPGEREEELRAALVELTAPEAVVVEFTGAAPRLSLFSLPRGSLTLYPSGEQYSAAGAWVQDIEIYNDDPGPSAAAFPNLGGTVDDLSIQRLDFLVSLSLPELVVVGSDLNIDNNEAMTSFTAPNLRAVAGEVTVDGNRALPSVAFPALEYAYNVYFGNADALSAISIPALATVQDSLGVFNVGQMQHFTAPSLRVIGNQLFIETCPLLESVSFPAIEVLGRLTSWGGTPALTSWTWGDGLREVKGEIVMSGFALNEESVDHVLTSLAGLDGTGGTVAYADQNVDLTGSNSVPSAIGLAAVEVLRGRGCNVSVNE